MIESASLPLDPLGTSPKAADFAALRSEGLSLIERMASATWTDYNTHDPGITLLEALCYAITDVAYRTGFPIADLLSEKSAGKNPDYPHFRTAAEILPCNPVTESDYRKLLIDLPKVRNAWIKPMTADLPRIYVDRKNSRLTYIPRFRLTVDALDFLEAGYQAALLAIPLGSVHSEEDFLDRIRSVLPQEQYRRHAEAILANALVRPRLRPDGLYRATLEPENHSELGDISVLRVELETGTGASILKGEAYIRIATGNLLGAHAYPDAPLTPSLSPFEYSAQKDIYTSILTLGDPLSPAGRLPVRVSTAAQNTPATRLALQNELSSRLPTLLDGLKARRRAAAETARSAEVAYHGHRSLCEDLEEIILVEKEEVVVCAEFEIAPEADVDAVAARILLAIENFLDPAIPFRSLSEMRSLGGRETRMDPGEIFSGPRLRHGFILDSELAAGDLREEVHASDLIHLIMEADGVRAVKKLLLSSLFLGEIIHEAQEWRLPITVGRAPRLAWRRTLDRLKFHKGFLPARWDAGKVEGLLREFRSMEKRSRPTPEAWDLPVPEGRNRNLPLAFSVQDDIPLVYGAGRHGIPGKPDRERKALAMQLKGFLHLSDRILGDSLAQLAHAGDLFSIDPDVRRTYFSLDTVGIPDGYRITQNTLDSLRRRGMSDALAGSLAPLAGTAYSDPALLEAALVARLGAAEAASWLPQVASLAHASGSPEPEWPRIEALHRDFVEAHPAVADDPDRIETFRPAWEDYRAAQRKKALEGQYLADPLRESQSAYETRKNRFLDHLLARYGEQFADYTLVLNSLEGLRAPAEVIETKQAFLRDYPAISGGRGKAFDYRAPGPAWNTDNLSGLERRVSRLAGMDYPRRRSFSDCGAHACETYQESDSDGVSEWRFRLRDATGNIILSGIKRYLTRGGVKAEWDQVLIRGRDRANYAVQAREDGGFDFRLFDEAGNILAIRKDALDSEDQAGTEIARVMARIAEAYSGCEGIHVVEHILLRPREGDEAEEARSLMRVCLSPECEDCLGLEDPYSFRVTAVLPSWPRRHQDLAYRRFLENTLREEAPAHVHVKVCWVGEEDMRSFEEAYRPWLEALAAPNPSTLRLRETRIDLLAALAGIRSVYEETRLHDCGESAHGGSLSVLDHSRLGTL